MILEQIMENKTYELNSSSMNYTMGFENGNIYCELFRRLKECQVSQVVKVVKKKTSLGAGDDISFRIYYLENGKEKKFPWIQTSIIDANTKAFFEDLKGRCGSHVIWEDRLSGANTAEDGSKVYDLQFLPFGYGGAGLTRGTQLWIYTICFAALIFPLIYFIKILATGGYKVYTDESGMEVRKFSSKKYTWESIQNMQVTNINVHNRENHTTTKVMRIDFIVNGKKKKLVMRHDHAVPLLKELVDHDIVSEDLVKDFL